MWYYIAEWDGYHATTFNTDTNQYLNHSWDDRNRDYDPIPTIVIHGPPPISFINDESEYGIFDAGPDRGDLAPDAP